MSLSGDRSCDATGDLSFSLREGARIDVAGSVPLEAEEEFFIFVLSSDRRCRKVANPRTVTRLQTRIEFFVLFRTPSNREITAGNKTLFPLINHNYALTEQGAKHKRDKVIHRCSQNCSHHSSFCLANSSADSSETRAIPESAMLRSSSASSARNTELTPASPPSARP